jgi:hypothetical protein
MDGLIGLMVSWSQSERTSVHAMAGLRLEFVRAGLRGAGLSKRSVCDHQVIIHVATVMRTPMAQREATAYVARWAKTNIAGPEQARFTEVCDTELLNVHEGNFAHFQVRPSAFAAWHALWTRA